jgi:hypothetical protein
MGEHPGNFHKSTLTNELNRVVEKMSMQSSNSEEYERETHISNEIFACVVIFIKNNTVVVVARICCLGTSNVGELLEI